jgi:hypothetical protein
VRYLRHEDISFFRLSWNFFKIGSDLIGSSRFNVSIVSVLIPVSTPFVVAVERGIRIRIGVRIIAARIAVALAALTHDMAVVECLRAAEDARGGTLALSVEGPGAALINSRRHRTGQRVYCVCSIVVGIQLEELDSGQRVVEGKEEEWQVSQFLPLDFIPLLGRSKLKSRGGGTLFCFGGPILSLCRDSSPEASSLKNIGILRTMSLPDWKGRIVLLRITGEGGGSG